MSAARRVCNPTGRQCNKSGDSNFEYVGKGSIPIKGAETKTGVVEKVLDLSLVQAQNRSLPFVVF
jgi:hypothetical protein